MVQCGILRHMTGLENADSRIEIADAQSEIARALRLSASLNNPDDHAVVAQYIAELSRAPGARTADTRATP